MQSFTKDKDKFMYVFKAIRVEPSKSHFADEWWGFQQ